MTTYASVTITWKKDGRFVSIVSQNCTIEEAKARAERWGYTEPKWWEVWRRSDRITVKELSSRTVTAKNTNTPL